MSADSNVSEPVLNTIFDPTTLVRKGLCPVTKIRHQNEELESHSLYYEQHGNGPEKILFIMGLNSTSFSWEPQVEYFGRKEDYSVLVFDNRGVGNSGTPRGPYSTSGMAEDTLVLLDYIGWKGKREVHIVGVSMGGMIAMELASRQPERIATLVLTVTTPGGWPWSNLPPWKGFSSLARLFFISDPSEKIPVVHEMVFPISWLDSIADGDPQGRTNRQVQTEKYARRMAAMRVQSPIGAISQMCAGLTHHVSKDRLRAISRAVPKVMILVGDEDHLVDPRNSAYIKEHMPEAEYISFQNTGHGIHLQRPERYCELVERAIKEGRERVNSQ